MMKMFREHAQATMFPDGKRMSLRHGPIDIVAEISASSSDVTTCAYDTAVKEFQPILPSLCEELDFLRRPLSTKGLLPKSLVGKRMYAAANMFSEKHFSTPMIAVAGSIADHLLEAVKNKFNIRKAYFNNGGDIALFLSKNEKFEIGVCSNIETGEISTRATITADDAIGGIATSGWRGRSHSLGIADAVTVFASNAAMADTAATLIANEVDIDASSLLIDRTPAIELNPDSDLGDQLVTVAVGVLSQHEKELALSRGFTVAEEMIRRGFIHSAYLSLQGSYKIAIDRSISKNISNSLISQKQSEKGKAYA